jgi:hypothetical protein
MVMRNYKLSSIIFSILVIAFISQSYADVTIKYSITEANWTSLSSPYNFSVKVWKDNTKDNPIIKETPYARFTIWAKLEGGSYGIYTNVTTINGYKSVKYNAELFNASGEHPSNVGYNPANDQWGDEDGELMHFGGILESDFGSHQTESNQTAKTPIPLSALIITLITIPLLTLKRVGK